MGSCAAKEASNSTDTYLWAYPDINCYYMKEKLMLRLPDMVASVAALGGWEGEGISSPGAFCTSRRNK